MNGWPLESSGLDLSRVFIERTQVLNRGLKFFGEKIDVLFEVGIFELLTDCQICNSFKTLYSTICYGVVSRYLTVHRLSIKFSIRVTKKVFFDINSYSFFWKLFVFETNVFAHWSLFCWRNWFLCSPFDDSKEEMNWWSSWVMICDWFGKH
jgi:hypothetical protein